MSTAVQNKLFGDARPVLKKIGRPTRLGRKSRFGEVFDR